jgi:hypothetical protein
MMESSKDEKKGEKKTFGIKREKIGKKIRESKHLVEEEEKQKK